MRLLLTLLLLLAFVALTRSQNVAINTTGAAPNASSMLDISSTTSGLLIPRMTTAQKNAITSPATGLLVYDTTTNSFWYYDGSSWVELFSGGDDYDWEISGTHVVTGHGGLYPAGNVGIKTSTPSAELEINGWIGRTAHNNGAFVGSYNNVGANSTYSNPIYVIGANYKPSATTLDNMYGVGYTHTNSSFVSTSDGAWGMYVAADGDARIWLAASSTGDSYFNAGDVGIGTTAPAAKLQVSNGRVEFTNTDDASGTANTGVLEIGNSLRIDGNEVITNSNTTLYLQNDNNGDLYVDGSSLIVDASTNMIGIGVAPTYNLELNGTFGFGNESGGYRSRTETRNDAGLQGSAGAQSGFFETSAPSPSSSWPSGASSWWHLIDCRHSNASNNYSLQIAGSFFDQRLYYRKTNNNASQAWSEILTTASINQSVTSVSSTSEVRLLSNNSGSYSSSAGVGYTTGTFQDVPNTSVSVTISSGNAVKVSFSARWELDTYNYYGSEMIWFRILRDGTEIGRTAAFTDGGVDGNGTFYFVDGNVSLEIEDTGVTTGSHTYRVQYWMTNSQSATESFFIGERYTIVTEIKI